MMGLPPFLQRGRNLPVRADSEIRGADDQIMGCGLDQALFAVGVDAKRLIVPLESPENDDKCSEHDCDAQELKLLPDSADINFR